MSLHTPSQGRPRVPLPRVLPPDARKKVEAAAEAHSAALAALIAFLDEFEDEREDEHDGREPDVDDEPSLGGYTGSGSIFGVDLELDTADDEPSLAHTLDIDQTTAQRNADGRNLRIAHGSGPSAWLTADEDREAEHDGREDGHDQEQENEHGETGQTGVGSTVDDEPRGGPNL